jgi:3-oxoadipate enol-lactonase
MRWQIPSIALVGLSALFSGCAVRDGTLVRYGYAPTPGGKLYYETAGEGPAVVLIHGGQMDRRMWDAQFKRLTQDFRVIRYDVRGYGKSPEARRPYSSHDDLRALLAYLGADRAHLVGLSLGGRIALDFALAYPQHVDKLVPVAPGLSGFAWPQEQRERAYRIAIAARDENLEAATELWLRDPCMAPAMENPAIAPRLRQLTFDNAHVWYMNYFLERPLQPPAVERLHEIKAPTLVIVGDRDVPDIQQIVEQLAAQVPDVRKVVIPGAGHIVNMEKPAEFNAALLGFLKDDSDER